MASVLEGVQVKPSVKFFDVSSLSFGIPAALAMALPFGARTTSSGTPLMKSVKVDEKYTCCSEGARKPVEPEPRSEEVVGEIR